MKLKYTLLFIFLLLRLSNTFTTETNTNTTTDQCTTNDEQDLVNDYDYNEGCKR